MMMGRRRFVNLVVENVKSGVFSVHRLNASEKLFYPSTAEAEASAKEKGMSRLRALPPPVTSFQSTPAMRMDQLFALVSPRIRESRILWNNPSDHTTLYDVESHSMYAMPRLSCNGSDSIAISVAGRPDAPEEDLYVLSNGPCFQVLRFGHPKRILIPNLPEGWQLETLPSLHLPAAALIHSHAVLHGGRTICITAYAPFGAATDDGTYAVERDDATYLTYLFDTVERECRQAPDGCNLPFSRGVEYDPSLKLWLGLCPSHRQLCASSDLDLIVNGGKQPTVKHQWEIVDTPEEWVPTKVSVINLGGGRFCIVKLIDVVPDKDWFDDWDDLGQQLALLTGVEIISSSSPQGVEEVQMVTHKSLITKDAIEWVL